MRGTLIFLQNDQGREQRRRRQRQRPQQRGLHRSQEAGHLHQGNFRGLN